MLYTINCFTCKKDFSTKKKTQKYCSMLCRNQSPYVKQKVYEANIGNQYAKGKVTGEVWHIAHENQFTEESRQKMREAKLKNPTKYWLGKNRDEETNEKISKNLTGRFCGEEHHFYGKHHTEESKEKLRQYTGDKTSNWRGGTSFIPYSFDWPWISKKIRKRDSHTCQICGKNIKEKFSSAVHHKNYNKLDNRWENLVSLCKQCHSMTNFDRDWWTMFLNKSPIIQEAYKLGGIFW